VEVSKFEKFIQLFFNQKLSIISRNPAKQNFWNRRIQLSILLFWFLFWRKIRCSVESSIDRSIPLGTTIQLKNEKLRRECFPLKSYNSSCQLSTATAAAYFQLPLQNCATSTNRIIIFQLHHL
jgi:hypothetical protein